MERFIADRRLYLTADHRMVEEGDPDAAFLLASPGGMIESSDVQRLGLELKGGKITQKNPPVGLPVVGGPLLDPRGAVKAAIKDQLKASMEVRFEEETDKEMERIKGEAGGIENAYSFALNRAGAISKDALRRRGDAPENEDEDKSREAVEKALKEEPKHSADKTESKRSGK